MSTLTLRQVKGTPLTNAEVDANFTALNTDKMEKSANLSDLASASTARTNLGVYSATQTDAAISAAAASTLTSAQDYATAMAIALG